ncbi:hypothetical protein GGX14DRAFT_390872 [Mycena pura]|uniref:Uncharacterized protein n=1 Tax=Mycena pura TaxID=153505 RepID=A0AAD6VNE4_9AGAR|nr:hypothetical protein GGX14DRAFT_390872 [Mycena pura]
MRVKRSNVDTSAAVPSATFSQSGFQDLGSSSLRFAGDVQIHSFTRVTFTWEVQRSSQLAAKDPRVYNCQDLKLSCTLILDGFYLQLQAEVDIIIPELRVCAICEIKIYAPGAGNLKIGARRGKFYTIFRSVACSDVEIMTRLQICHSRNVPRKKLGQIIQRIRLLRLGGSSVLSLRWLGLGVWPTLLTTAFSNQSFTTASMKRERDGYEGLPEAKKHHTESLCAYCPVCHRRFAGTKNRNRHIGINKCIKDAKRSGLPIPTDLKSLENADRHEELKDSCDRLWGVQRVQSQTPATHPVTGGISAPGVGALSSGSLPHLQSPYPNHATLTAGRNMHSHLPQMPPIPASQPWPPYVAASQAHAMPISQGGAPGLRRFNSEPGAWASTGNVNWGQLPQRPSTSAQMARYHAPAVPPGTYSSPGLQSATPNPQPNPVGLSQSSSCAQPQRMAQGPTRLQQSASFSGHGAFRQPAFSPMQPVQTGGANHGGAGPTYWQQYQAHLQRLPYLSQAGRMPLQSAGRPRQPDHLSVPPISAPYPPNTQVPSDSSHVTAPSARENTIRSEHISSSATPSRSSTPANAPNQTSDPQAHFGAFHRQYQHSSPEGAAAVLETHPAPSPHPHSTPCESSALTSPAVEAAVNLDLEDFSWNVYTPAPRGKLVRLSSQSVLFSQSPSGATQDEGQHEAPQSLSSQSVLTPQPPSGAAQDEGRHAAPQSPQVAGSTPDAAGRSWTAWSPDSDIPAETLVDPATTGEAPIEVPTELDSALGPLASGSQSAPEHSAGGIAEPGEPFNFAETFHKLAAELNEFLDSFADINLVVDKVLAGKPRKPRPESMPADFWESLQSLICEEPAPRQKGASTEKQLGTKDARELEKGEIP